MDPYEQEQLDALKAWWNKNGVSVIAGLGAGIAAVIGWQLWSDRQIRQAEAASDAYQDLAEAIRDKDREKAADLAGRLREEYDFSVYAVFAVLTEARLAVEDERLEDAKRHLRWVIEHAEQRPLRELAHLRLIRTLLANRDLDEVDEELERIGHEREEREGFLSAALLELRGDLLVLRDEFENAREAYRLALAADIDTSDRTLDRDPAWRDSLEMKLQDLGGEIEAGASGQETQEDG